MYENSAQNGTDTVRTGCDVIAERVADAVELLVTTHARPDADGLGSLLAIYHAGTRAGKKVHILVPDSIPPRLAFMFNGVSSHGIDEFDSLADQSDLIMIVDTCAIAQLDTIADGLIARQPKVVVVDHHSTFDEIGSARWIDASAAAAGVMVGELIGKLGWDLCQPAAEALAMAVTSDTGWLRFANTDGRCLRAMASWVDVGVRPDKLYMRLHQTDRPERLTLLVRMLESLEFFFDDRLATMIIRRGDFEETGARMDETENMVNEALRIGQVESVVLLVEYDEGVRVSLRSRDRVNVAKVAKKFGGGGHQRAAGLRSNEDIDGLKDKLVEAFRQVMEQRRSDVEE